MHELHPIVPFAAVPTSDAACARHGPDLDADERIDAAIAQRGVLASDP